jgi:hypothetical protein
MSAELKTKYKYISFVESNHKGIAYDCINNRTKTVLAYIFYYKKWNEYCFSQANQGMIFNDGCLLDVVNFIQQLNKKI